MRRDSYTHRVRSDRLRAAVAAVAIGAVVALVHGASGGASSSTAAPKIVYGSFPSTAVKGTLHYAVALPPGYDDSGLRYPVVYFLHGLPAGPQAYRSIRGLADSLAGTGHDAIVVGAQGARTNDTDPEWRNWGPGRNWETATEEELVRWIDGHYRTIGRRSARAIIGVSGGGYGATLIAFHHPATYQVVEAWSGYFSATNPAGKPLDLGSAPANAFANAHTAVPTLKRELGRFPKTFFGFYIGNKDPYPGFVADNKQLSRELTAAGVPHRFRIYDGAHNFAFWNRHQDEWLAAAVERLDPPS